MGLLIADSEIKLQAFLDRVVDEREKKEATINCKRKESMIIRKTKKFPVMNWSYKHQAGAEVQMSGKRFNRGWRIRHRY